MPENSPANLADWLTYLEALHPKTIELGLERVNAVKTALQLTPSFPVILVGGTNGKGSTCAYLEAMLAAAGYRVGLYTSPHLLRYNERVRIDHRIADDAALCTAFSAVETARGAVSLSYFEFGTLAAMWLFARAEVDVAVLEVGLGGRLDAVNVFDPECSIVTSVDIDHTEYLGDTREKIGFEKAGIFRAGRPAICGDEQPPQSLLQHASDIGADLRVIGVAFSAVPEASGWHYNGQHEFRDLPHPAMTGRYQFNNAACAIAALETLGERLPVTEAAIRHGLQTACAVGRFQILPGQPEVILDVAHNPHAAAALAANLKARPSQGKTLVLMAMLADKDINGVVQAMQHEVDEWLLASLDVPRGATAQVLHEVLRKAGISVPITCSDNVEQGWRLACERARENDRICVFGSFYTVAQVLQLTGR
ncbi:bifunctional tetrahydrofolate synthase/dihydrofolate synthase [Sulfuriferula sp. GW1]|uniref:bifunctional tetrahydrofolate synthase/dihydrofolate synthase n=1 Tax=Sulfuriferula sp. GW1 TaxID=3345111 RepID=UPI0039AEC61F